MAESTVTNKYVSARIEPPGKGVKLTAILAVSTGVPYARTMRVGVDYNVGVQEGVRFLL